MRKFKEEDTVRVINGDLLLDNDIVEEVIGELGIVKRYDSIDDTYYVNIIKDEDNFGWWIHETCLEEVKRSTIHFEPVIDEKRKHINVELQMPKMGTKDAIACDFYSPVDITIKPMESGMIWTDVKAIFPREVALLINVRSSMGSQPIMLANTQGWIENDYANNKKNDGNIGINLFNLGKTDYVIKKGDRIAQGMFVNVIRAEGTETDNERVGGYGSTGV